MIDSILSSIQTSIGARLADAFAFAFSPLWRWYFIGGGIIAGLVVLAWLSRLLFDVAPMRWFRVALGVAILLVGAFLAGGRTMYREQQERLKAERERARKAKAVLQQPRWG